MAAGIIVTLWQGWQSGRKADTAQDTAGAAAAYVVTANQGRDYGDSVLSARVDHLERELHKMRRLVRAGKSASSGGGEVEEPAPPPRHKSWLERLLGNS